MPEQLQRTSPFEIKYPLTVQSTVRLRGEDVRVDGQPGEAPGPYFPFRGRVTSDGEVTITFAAWGGPAGAAGGYAVSMDASRAARAAVRLPFSCR